MATRWSPQNKSGLPRWRWLNSDVEGGWRSARGQWWSCRLSLHLSKHLPVSFCCVTMDKARRSVIKSLAEMRAVVEQQRETLIGCKWAVCHQITRRAVSSTLLVAHGIEICNANTKRTGSGERRFLWSTSQEKIQKLRSLGMELKWSKRGLNCETQARPVLSVKKLRSVLPSQPPSALNDNQENLITHQVVRLADFIMSVEVTGAPCWKHEAPFQVQNHSNDDYVFGWIKNNNNHNNKKIEVQTT